MYSRRTIMQGIGAASLLPSATLAQTGSYSRPAEAAAMEAWITDPDNAQYFDPPKVSGPQRGTLILRPGAPEVAWAAGYVADLPAIAQPVDLAKYMIRTIPANHIMEWPPDTPGHRRPANPLIIEFFQATRTKPYAGDETAWCAAFACWTLRRCGRAFPNSAGSASFRDFAALPQTTDPVIGDLVVFKHRDRPANGHVAYFDGFVDRTKRRVWCVGGNQGNRISRSSFTVAHSEMFVHSYRSVPRA